LKRQRTILRNILSKKLTSSPKETEYVWTGAHCITKNNFYFIHKIQIYAYDLREMMALEDNYKLGQIFEYILKSAKINR